MLSFLTALHKYPFQPPMTFWWQVTEAIQIGARAIKENRISVEEVQLRLQELEDSIDLQKQVDNALGNFAGLTDLG